jgi:hypothetical protein
VRDRGVADVVGAQVLAPLLDSTCAGKVQFCLTKLRALRATSSTFALPHLVDALNALRLTKIVAEQGLEIAQEHER